MKWHKFVYLSTLSLYIKSYWKLNYSDARGGVLRGDHQDHAGLQDEGDVQTLHGRVGSVHVPAGHPGAGASP